ncbi:MAG: TatD family nuclease-associated radical SAM protein, partial [Clostridia bacterium]|nr:TatD family nuclease-associated radical SAM protein [Clostridia bacterium]
MADILYTFEGHLYLNITNRCPCDCVFCIRQNGDGVGSAETLWHRHDPSTDEVMAALRSFDFSPYTEAVFCGYGEPTMALDTLLAAARYLKEIGLNVRLNTNGLSDLINGKPTAALFEGLVDAVSISLNAPSAARYNEVTRPSFGERAFEAMLSFAQDCKRYIPSVAFT